MRDINEIIIHCSATPEGSDFTVDDIRRWHKSSGFNDIGYHFVIYRDGTIHQGRHLDVVGAHTTGHNNNSIGICYIGGIDKRGKAKDTRTDEQKVSLYNLCCELHIRFPKATFHGHNEYANKACPCFDVSKWALSLGLPV